MTQRTLKRLMVLSFDFLIWVYINLYSLREFYETNETLPVTGSSSATNLDMPPDAGNAFLVDFIMIS